MTLSKNKSMAVRTNVLKAVVLIFGLIFSMAVYAAEVTLNMVDTDIRALITTVSEVTGKNFIIDPRVKGKVTVISSRPMGKDELYQVFLSILEVHGYSAIPRGDVIKILPQVEAKQSGIPTATQGHPGLGDEIVTRVIPIEYSDAQQLVPILRPLVPQQGHLAAFANTNVLIISDTAQNIRRIIRIIRRIDRPSTDEIEIITLEHASAAEVVRILESLSKQQKSKKKEAPGNALTIVADERTNSILLGGEKSQRLRLRAIISHLDSPIASGGNTQVFFLQYADAENLVPILSSVTETIKTSTARGKKIRISTKSQVSIQADKSTNSLVITAAPDLMQSLRSVIEKLDVRRAQVLIEAIIAEVTTGKAAELGIQFYTANANFSGNNNGTFATSNLPGNQTGSVTAVNPAAPGVGLTLGGFSGLTGNFLDLSVLLRAIESDDDSNILSTPSLLTLDNQEAEITVGQNVPFLTGTTQTTGGLANPFQTIERKDVGVKLKVTPQINKGNTVKLEIEQEISSIAPTAVGVNTTDIVTNKRLIRTTVLVDDGATVVLGGLIEDKLTQSEQSVPLLGDIPIIGNLFKTRRSDKTKTNLMVFLRPVIMRDSKVSDKQTAKRYDFMRGKQQGVREQGVRLLDDKTSPLLPPIDEELILPPPFKDTADGQMDKQGAGE